MPPMTIALCEIPRRNRTSSPNATPLGTYDGHAITTRHTKPKLGQTLTSQIAARTTSNLVLPLLESPPNAYRISSPDIC